MFETKSDDYLFEEDLTMNTANDSLFSVLGILSQQQKLAERYVLFGELRGDLVSVPATANLSLQEIAAFNVSQENAYLSKADFYNVINNCNYAIARMDTSLVVNNRKVLMSDYVGIRSIRAWVQMQLALSYGELTWYTDPIYTVDAANADYPVLGVDEALNQILLDIQPYIGSATPDFGNVDGYNTSEMFVPMSLIAADIYLYQNNYAMAAMLYYDYIDNHNLTISANNGNQWGSSSREGVNASHNNTYNNEVISRIVFPSNGKDYHPQLINMTYSLTPQMVPAQWFMNDMDTVTHFYAEWLSNNSITGTFNGDLRGMATLQNRKGDFAGAYGYTHVNDDQTDILITKFFNNGNENGNVSIPDNEMFDHIYARQTRTIATYRTPTLYLRYAEAINRTGRPNMAFAVLKNGLNYKTVTDSLVVPDRELESGDTWLNFKSDKYDNSYGTAMRGRGYGIRLNKSTYNIPELPTLNDSIEWVENEILYELAAETCFEGNRFFDLLRMSRHRADHPALLVERVSRRMSDDGLDASRLANQANWWVK